MFLARGLGTWAANLSLRHVAWWGWLQFFLPTGALLLPSLSAGIFLARTLDWLSITASVLRYLAAALILVVSYPLAFVAMVGMGIGLNSILPASRRPASPLLAGVLDQAPVTWRRF